MALDWIADIARQFEAYGVQFLARVERRVCGPWSNGHEIDVNEFINREDNDT